MKKILPLLALLLGALYFGSGLRTPSAPAEFDVAGFGRLPVLLNGRLKPLDTVARTTLLTLQGRQRVSNPELPAPYVRTPTEWLLDVVYRPERADTYTTFKIDNHELLGLIGKSGDTLKVRYTSGAKQAMAALGFLPGHHSRFSYNDLAPHLPEIDRQARLADATDAKRHTPFQRAVLTLRTNLNTYQRLRHTFIPPETPRFLNELTTFQETLTQASSAVIARQASKPLSPVQAAALRTVEQSHHRDERLATFAYARPFPPADPARLTEWRALGETMLASYQDRSVPPEVIIYAALGEAWRGQHADSFNRGLALYRNLLAKRFASTLRHTDFEHRFNAAEPFYKAIVVFGFAFLLAICSWIRWPDTLGRSAFYLIAAAFAATTAGLLARMWIGGYAPVTNLYSSALFVGWVATGLCLILEAIYKNAIGSVAAGMIGFGTLIIAHHLSLTGDTLEMMRAVLDSNLWLSTHVVTVTAGYGATFLAGALAIIYIVLGLFTRVLAKPFDQRTAPSSTKAPALNTAPVAPSPSVRKTETTADAITRMVYGIVCFAMLFSFVGTVLGGIWADQSWGRFWGWDPKENGALIIVIWNAIILHARWGGLVKQRGLMALAVFGNVVTGWSWFGTNLLEVGLHSYGFTDSGAQTLAIFVAIQLAIIALALVPLEKWRSFAAKTT